LKQWQVIVSRDDSRFSQQKRNLQCDLSLGCMTMGDFIDIGDFPDQLQHRGGRTAAILASLTSDCRRHEMDPQLYFIQLLMNLPS
jgi:hypothetical protein